MTHAEHSSTRPEIKENKMLKLICALALLILVNVTVLAQAPIASKTLKSLKSLQLENVEIKGQTIGAVFSELSLSYNIPIGVEIAASDNRLHDYELNFKRGTLSELLTEFVKKHDPYTWTIKNGIVNIVPADKYRDSLFQTLLAIQLTNFSVQRHTDCAALADSLMSTPEVKRVLEERSAVYRGLDYSGFYIPQLGREFTLPSSERTLQATLNAVVSTSPTAKFWVLTRNEDGTISLGFSARQEDMPAGQKFSSKEIRP